MEELLSHLNAEVVLGAVTSVIEGMKWLSFTYLVCVEIIIIGGIFFLIFFFFFIRLFF
jgi:hypothetical protein